MAASSTSMGSTETFSVEASGRVISGRTSTVAVKVTGSP